MLSMSFVMPIGCGRPLHLRLRHSPSKWAAFKQHHEGLEDCYKYRRMRFLIWRASALKVTYDRDAFQDQIDAKLARDTLLATLHFFWGDFDVNGNAPDSAVNFW